MVNGEDARTMKVLQYQQVLIAREIGGRGQRDIGTRSNKLTLKALKTQSGSFGV
jgi:hypothetical protein